MASFVEELQAKKHEALRSEAYGWSVENGEETAFVYGKVRWNCIGNTAVVPPDKSLAQDFHPHGKLEVWKNGCRLVTSQGRPALDAIVAAGFGGPLVNFTGHNGFVMCAYSPETGIGKSTAMQVSQAVWGHPVSGMAGLNDTGNYANSRLGLLRHLPFLFDEIKMDEQNAKLVEMVFGMGQGKTRGRLNRTATAQQVQTFATLLVAASNSSLAEYVMDHTKLTTAGLYRIFEFRVEPNRSGTGMVDGAAAQTMLGDLRENYGNAGLVYAQFLGQNAKTVKKQIADAYSQINTTMKATSDERFWVATMTVLLMGAKYGNQLGLTEIDIPALSEFLVGEFQRMRGVKATSSADITTAATLDQIVGDYVNTRRQQTVITDTIWRQPTRPPANYKVMMIGDHSKLHGRLTVHAAKTDMLLRISQADFGNWLREKRGLMPGVMIGQIFKTLPAKPVKSRIGLHTVYELARENLIEFDLTLMQDFYDF